VVLALAALGPVACSEVQDPSGPALAPAFGVASPGTTVSATATVSLPGQTVIRESGAGNGAGTCGAGGEWTNPAGHASGPVPHAPCTSVTDGVELVVRFSDLANWVTARSGNEQLNFGKLVVCDDVACEEGDDRAIHYTANKNYTTGQGVLQAIDQNGGLWTIDLSEVTGPGNLLNRAGTPVSACNVTWGCWPAALTW
jgi:hypothetical protein